MDKGLIWKERIKFFLLGVISISLMLILTGARDITEFASPALDNGRYQISAWGTRLNDDSGAIGVFVVDTVSGETKTVYTRIYGTPPATKVVKNDLKRPFSSIR